ncbi:hypothetical protein BDR06DRAFT_977903 [Suillus hirtellus]|nr:hypothetical protein BDR06DRAFT_977903 [Suillus hirtellus]
MATCKEIVEVLEEGSEGQRNTSTTDCNHKKENIGNSHSDFNNKNAEMFAEGIIYPKIKIDNIKYILSEATESLKDYIVLLMEGMELEKPEIWSVCESHPVWDLMWEAALDQIPTAIYLTAYCHYVDWHHHKYEKHKLSVTLLYSD